MSKRSAPCTRDHTGKFAKKPTSAAPTASSSRQTRSVTRALLTAEPPPVSQVPQLPPRNPSPTPSVRLDDIAETSPEDSDPVEFVFPASAAATHNFPGSFSPSPERATALKSTVSALQTALATPPNSTTLSALAAATALIEATADDFAETRALIAASSRSSSVLASRLASISDPTSSFLPTHFPSSENSPSATARLPVDLDPAATPVISRFRHHSPTRSPSPEPNGARLHTSYRSPVLGPRVNPALVPVPPSPDLAPVSPTHTPISAPTPVSAAQTSAFVPSAPGFPGFPPQTRPLPVPPPVSSAHPLPTMAHHPTGPAAMPGPRSKSAPSFTGHRSESLADFLQEYEELAELHQLTESQKVETITRYTTTDLKNYWRDLPGYSTLDWPRFCRSLRLAHPQLDFCDRFTKQRLFDYASKCSRTRIRDEEDVLIYYQNFARLSTALLNNLRLTNEDRDKAFFYGFHPEDRQLLVPRILMSNPRINSRDAYPITAVLEAARLVFAGPQQPPFPLWEEEGKRARERVSSPWDDPDSRELDHSLTY
jgi:hypothetical protein